MDKLLVDLVNLLVVTMSAYSLAIECMPVGTVRDAHVEKLAELERRFDALVDKSSALHATALRHLCRPSVKMGQPGTTSQ